MQPPKARILVIEDDPAILQGLQDVLVFNGYSADGAADGGQGLTAALAQEYGLVAHRALRLRGYSRTDMIVDNDDIYILETNTIPGMTPTSLLPQAAAAVGLSFSALIDKLLELAME